MSEIQEYIKDDFKDLMKGSHFIANLFFGMIHHISRYLWNFILKIVKQWKFFLGIIILVCVSIPFLKDKQTPFFYVFWFIINFLKLLLFVAWITLLIECVKAVNQIIKESKKIKDPKISNKTKVKAFFKILGLIFYLIFLIIPLFILIWLFTQSMIGSSMWFEKFNSRLEAKTSCSF
jgi:hypothetical protein